MSLNIQTSKHWELVLHECHASELDEHHSFYGKRRDSSQYVEKREGGPSAETTSGYF